MLLQGYCVPGCAENAIGILMYKYILTNGIAMNLVEIFTGLGYKCLSMASFYDPPTVSYLHACFLWLVNWTHHL